jgi:DNA-binding XRE family transcriptional regulator
MKHPNQIVSFIDALATDCPNAKVSVDAPRDPKGEWWLDISGKDFQNTVAWRAESGFGVFVSPDRGYGDQPDEIYKKADLAARRVCGLIERHSDSETSGDFMRLKELRQLVGAPQTKLAESLNIKQAAVSRFENRQDVHISTLAHYVEAIGGHLEVRARFDDFEVRIDPLPAERKMRG